ncbi:hypothetical protein ANTRET_LOCUS4184 [Anthophora retusa]
MSNARGYPPYPPRGKKLHGPSRCRFYTGPPSSRRSRDQDGRDLLYDLHTITGQSEGTHTHATQTKKKGAHSIVAAVRWIGVPTEERRGEEEEKQDEEKEKEAASNEGETRGEKRTGESGREKSRTRIRRRRRRNTRNGPRATGRIAECCSGFESRGCRDVDERQSAWAAQ